MRNTNWRRPRRSVIALMIILLGAFAVVPSATANAGHHHKRHIQHFLLVTSDPAEDAQPIIIANGPIHAKGTDTTLSDTEDTFTFPRGKLYITHHPKKNSEKDTFDPKTCYFTYSERGTYKVTGGTGAYEDAHGWGRYALKVTGVGCDESAPPDYYNFRATAAGPLRY